MPGVYFHKLLDFFPTSTAMSLDSHSWCLEFIFIYSWTFSQRLLLCPSTVTVDAWSFICCDPRQSQLMPGVYFHKLLDFFQRLLLCPSTVTVEAWSLSSYTSGLFPNVYCYVPRQSQLMPGILFAVSLDSHRWCLEFIFINSWTFSQRLLLSPSTVTVDAWSLFS